MGSRLLKLESFTRLSTKQTNSYNFIMGEEEIDMVGLFYKLANAEQEGKDATLDRKKITMAEEVLASMDADNSGDIDLDEWTNCMTKELRIAIYRQLNNKDKLAGSLSKDEIKNAMNCLGLKAWDVNEFFNGLDEDKNGEISLAEFKDNLPSYVFKAMAQKLNDQGLIEGM